MLDRKENYIKEQPLNGGAVSMTENEGKFTGNVTEIA